MDSGNSNSVQSSSGGDEEYDSRAESISSFLNNNKSNNNPSIYLPRPAPATAHHHLYNTSLFDPLSSNYTFDPLSSSSSRLLASSSSSSNPNSLLNNNLDMVWSRNLRSEPNCTDLGGGLFIPSTSSPPPFSSSPAMLLQHIPRGGGGGGGGVTESVSKAASSSFLATSSSGHGRLNTDHSSLIRNPKKRSRASRRAPTTVLTTDTTNFRAMVQEFTGIPAPPFTSSSSPFSRTRLDLFGTSSRSPSYNLLRPFAQKPINPIPFNNNSSNNNSMIDAIASASTITAATPLQPSQNLFNINMQNNSILNLHSHSLLQLPTKYPLTNSPNNNLETKPPQQGSSLKDLGGAAHLNTNNTLMSGLQSWPGAGVVGSNENREEELEPFANGKLSNFSQVASSEFHRDKGQENVNAAAAATTTTRTEGMVESWICSSD